MKSLIKYKNSIFYLFVFMLFLLNCILINDSVWYDEIFTLTTIKLDFNNMIEIIISDVHPPLYYFILKFFYLFSNLNVNFFKLLSIIPTFICILIVHSFLNHNKYLTDKYNITSFIFALILGVSSPFIYYSLEIRMYSLAMLFNTCSALFAYQIYYDNSNKLKWTFFILFSILAAYTHYFSLIIEFFIYSYLFILLIIKNKNNIKKCIYYSFITFLLYTPWLSFFIKQFSIVRNNYWITFEFKNILQWLHTIFLNLDILSIIFILIIILICILKYFFKNFSQDQKQSFYCGIILCSLPFLLILFALIITIFLRPLFISRYLLPSLALFWLGFLILLNTLKYKKIYYLIFIILLIINIFISYTKLFNEEYFNNTSNTVNKINMVINDENILLTNIYDLSENVLQYYFPNNTVININNFNDNNNINEIILYFDEINNSSLDIIFNKGYNIDFIYCGNIDNAYYFNLYKIYK